MAVAATVLLDRYEPTTSLEIGIRNQAKATNLPVPSPTISREEGTEYFIQHIELPKCKASALLTRLAPREAPSVH